MHRSLLSQPLPQELNGHIKFNDFEFIQEQYLDKVEGYDKRTVSARMTLEGIKKGVIIDDEHEDEKEDLKTRLHKAIAEKVEEVVDSVTDSAEDAAEEVEETVEEAVSDDASDEGETDED